MRYTLDIYIDYLISSTGRANAAGSSSLHDGAISHDQVTRLLPNSCLDFKDLWRKAKPLTRQTQAKLPEEDFALCPNQRNDIPIFRLADVLLMKAEAIFRLGQFGQTWGLKNPQISKNISRFDK